MPTAFLQPPGLTMFSPYAYIYATHHGALHPLVTNPSSMLGSPVIINDENDSFTTSTATSIIGSKKRANIVGKIIESEKTRTFEDESFERKFWNKIPANRYKKIRFFYENH